MVAGCIMNISKWKMVLGTSRHSYCIGVSRWPMTKVSNLQIAPSTFQVAIGPYNLGRFVCKPPQKLNYMGLLLVPPETKNLKGWVNRTSLLPALCIWRFWHYNIFMIDLYNPRFFLANLSSFSKAIDQVPGTAKLIFLNAIVLRHPKWILNGKSMVFDCITKYIHIYCIA